MLLQLDAVSLATSALAVAGTGYAIYGAQLFLRQRSIVFKPSRMLTAEPSTLGLEFDDVSLPQEKSNSIHGWWVHRERWRKVVLFCCGSIGNMSREVSTLAFLCSGGAAVLAFDYPGFGRSNGIPSEKGCYEAAESAWEYLIEGTKTLPEDIYIYGRSVGAAVAAWLAARHECAGLLLQSGPTSVPDVAAFNYPLVPSRWFCYIRFNTLRYVRASKSPVLVMHSETDTIIPFLHGIRIFDQAPPPKRFVQLTGDHYGNQWQMTPGLLPVLKDLFQGESRLWI